MTRRPVTALAASLPALPEPQSLASGWLAVRRRVCAAEVMVPGPADVVLAGQGCAVPGCGRRCQGRGLCGSHYSRWHKSGKPGLAEFTAATGPVVRAWPGLRAAEGYDLRGMPPQLRLEIAYALQCRSDERGPGLRPYQVAAAVRLLAGADVTSLLDRARDELDAVRSESTRLNSSHQIISYAVFCLKKKTINTSSPQSITPHLCVLVYSPQR